MSKTTNKFSPEVRARAVRMILDHEGDYPSRWSAVVSVADKIGCAPQTLHEWVKKVEVDSGKRAGVPTDTADKLKALEREVRELRQANEILRKASAYFALGKSSTARSSDDRVYRRSACRSWGRADLQRPADRPFHLSQACRAATRSITPVGAGEA
jgi:transposase-like protein